MFGRKKWVEVYFGSSMDKFFKIKYLLQQQHIEYKTKTDSARGRSARGFIAGGNPMIMNTSGDNSGSYTIMVKEEDEHLARHLISSNRD